MPSYVRSSVHLAAAVCTMAGGSAAVEAQSSQNLLPPATGPHAVGRVTYHWVDSARSDPFSPAARARREMLVDVWYPAGTSSIPHRSTYLPELAEWQRVVPDSILQRRFTPTYGAITAGQLWSSSREYAAAQCDPDGCPLLVFSPGAGVDRSFYTAQYEEYASHGYVLAVIAHPYNTHAVLFPDGRTVRAAPTPPDPVEPDHNLPVWRQMLAREARAIEYQRRHAEIAAADIQFVLDQLTRYSREAVTDAPFRNQVDLSRIGVLGHSLGGQAAARACQRDSRIAACLNQDGVMGNLPFMRDSAGQTMTQPFMYLGRPYAPTPASDSVLIALQMTREQEDSLVRAVAARMPELLRDVAGGAWKVTLTVPGMGHMGFSDESLVRAAGDSERTANATLALRLVRNYTRAFFDQHLKRDITALPDPAQGADSTYVLIERFAPTSSR